MRSHIEALALTRSSNRSMRCYMPLLLIPTSGQRQRSLSSKRLHALLHEQRKRQLRSFARQSNLSFWEVLALQVSFSQGHLAICLSGWATWQGSCHYPGVRISAIAISRLQSYGLLSRDARLFSQLSVRQQSSWPGKSCTKLARVLQTSIFPTVSQKFCRKTPLRSPLHDVVGGRTVAQMPDV